MNTLIAFVTILCTASVCASRPDMDLILALLRGSWEFHTYEERFTLEFLSDDELVMNRRNGTYSIAGDKIFIVVDGEELNGHIDVNPDRLILQLENGIPVTYKRDEFGTIENRLNNVFYMDQNNHSSGLLSFQQRQRFTFQAGYAPCIIRPGVFRIAEEEIKLVFDDGEVSTAMMRYSTQEGIVEGIEYRDTLYEPEVLPVSDVPPQIEIILVGIPPQEPPCCMLPEPPPSAAPTEATTPGNDMAPSPETTSRTVRNSGSERAGQPRRVRP